MQNKPVSIITVTYNCSQLIEEHIVSCLKFGNCETIIIDNNSTDGTRDILERYNNQIKVIFNTENKGYTAANNQGIKQATEKYIFLLNPDASLTEGAIENMIQAFESDNKIGAIAPVLYFPDGTVQNYTRLFPFPTALFVESFVPMRFWNKFPCYRKYTCHGLDFHTQQTVEQPAGAAIFFENNKLLDENYFIYVSDVDLCRSFYADGKKIIQIPEAKIIHHQSKGGTEFTNHTLRMYLDLDNYFGMRFFFKKYNYYFRRIFFEILFFFGLLFTGLAAIRGGKHLFKIKMKRFFYFLRNYNFKNYYAKQ